MGDMTKETRSHGPPLLSNFWLFLEVSSVFLSCPGGEGGVKGAGMVLTKRFRAGGVWYSHCWRVKWELLRSLGISSQAFSVSPHLFFQLLDLEHQGLGFPGPFLPFQ